MIAAYYSTISISQPLLNRQFILDMLIVLDVVKLFSDLNSIIIRRVYYMCVCMSDCIGVGVGWGCGWSVQCLILCCVKLKRKQRG